MARETINWLNRHFLLLRKSEIWSTLPDETLFVLASAMELKFYEPGQFIIEQGQPGNYLYIIVRGQAEVRVSVAENSVSTVATLQDGDCAGEMSLLSGDPTSANVIAVTQTEALTLDRSAFNGLVDKYPSILREFVRLISKRLHESHLAVAAAHQKHQDLTRFLQDEKKEQYSILIGRSPAVKELKKRIEEQSLSEAPLLIQGEKGTGKELVARMIHYEGLRQDGPLLSVECGQITESQWGDSLFGVHYRQTMESCPNSTCYMDLAEGGSILLKNIESMSLSLQERLARFLEGGMEGGEFRRRDVRVLMTSRHVLADMTAAGRVNADLAAAIADNVISVSPLRDRKKDIPEIADHFLKKHALRLAKKIERLDDQALIKLITYDYSIANVQELDEAIERAIILTDDSVIASQHIFIGPPAETRRWGFNLFKLPEPVVKMGLRLFPSVFRIAALALFAFILYECLFSNGRSGITLVWSLWWPALIISFFFIGRIWCAICPISLVGSIAQRFVSLKRRVPEWLKTYGVYIPMAGFLAIIWVEEATAMRENSLETGFLLLFIMAGAVVTSVLFPRRTWCRYICPLGGFAGLCSVTAPLEIRPSVDICAAKCKGHYCFKGSEGVEGCPMFNHVMFLDTNMHCSLCMQCVRNCPDKSPQLHLRLPIETMWTKKVASQEIGAFVVLTMGLLVPLMMIHNIEGHSGILFGELLARHRFASVTLALAVCALLPVLALWLAARTRKGNFAPETCADLWQKIAAFIPLTAAGYICYELFFVPGLPGLRGTVQFASRINAPFATIASYSFLTLAQCAVLLLGLVLTASAFVKIMKSRQGLDCNLRLNREVWFMGVLGYWALILIFILNP